MPRASRQAAELDSDTVYIVWQSFAVEIDGRPVDASSPPMAAMSGRAELPEVVEYVRQHLRGFAPAYDEIGLRVTGLEVDTQTGEPFPALLIYVERDGVDGERVARYSLEHNGELKGPGDAAGSVAFWALESTRAEIARLPRSNQNLAAAAPLQLNRQADFA
jgi:hypothetical protein